MVAIRDYSGRFEVALNPRYWHLWVGFKKKRDVITDVSWSGKRDSNSRPRPWQGRALPTELFPQLGLQRYSENRKLQIFLSNLIDLHLQGDAEAGGDIRDDGAGERQDIFSGGASEVDQHQRLLLIDGGASQRTAFPARAVDQPGGGDLDQPLSGLIMRHLRVLRRQFPIPFLRHDGVHKETAGVAQDGGGRKFFAPHRDHLPADVGGGKERVAAGMTADPSGKAVGQRAVGEVRLEGGLQPVSHVGDDVFLVLRPLEDAVPVSVAALFGGENALLAGLGIDSLHLDDQVLDLHAVSADVLDGGGTGVARDSGEVLRSVPAVREGVGDEGVPIVAGADPHAHFALLFAGADRHRTDVAAQDGPFEVAAEEQVGAAPDGEQLRASVRAQLLQRGDEFRLGVILDETVRPDVDAESVVTQQGVIVLGSQGHRAQSPILRG